MAVAGSALALSTGVVIDRLLLPDLHSGSKSASDSMANPATAKTAGLGGSGGGGNGAATGTGTGTGAQGGAAGKPSPTAPETTPPLKTVRAPGGGTSATPSPSPTPSESTPPSSSAPPPGSAGPETTVALLTNTERAKAGCSPLRIDQRLVTAARRHSSDMAANNYFDHTSRNGDSPWKRMEDAGYSSPGAENIAKGYGTAAAVVEGWMKSPGHRANILNCKLRAIGVGKADGTGGPLWTQDFGWK